MEKKMDRAGLSAVLAEMRREKNISYYKLYCESWANLWGQRWSGYKQIDAR